MGKPKTRNIPTSTRLNQSKQRTGMALPLTCPGRSLGSQPVPKAQRPGNIPSLPNINSAEEVNNSLISHFFPPQAPAPPSHLWSIPETRPVYAKEVAAAVANPSNRSTSGPDSISYSIWKKTHSINPTIFCGLISTLLMHGIHPKCLKSSNGNVLPKSNKPNYSKASSFQIIVLLQTIGKIWERICTAHLFTHAAASELIYHTQCGSLPGRSLADTPSTIMQEIGTLQATKQKVSTLFLDIKEGFDNVVSSILACRLWAHHTPEYMIA